MTPDELRKYRETLGLSQAELSRMLGVPNTTVNRWERGVMKIASPTILRLALYRLSDDLRRDEMSKGATTCRCGRPAYLGATGGIPRCPSCEYLPCETCDCVSAVSQ